MSNPVIQSISGAVVVAIASLLAINSYVYTREDGKRLEDRVTRNEEIVRTHYDKVHSKLDKLKDLIIELKK